MGAPPEVHYHLHSFERVQLQVVATAPQGELFNFPPVCRLISISDEADDSMLAIVIAVQWSEAVGLLGRNHAFFGGVVSPPILREY